MSDRTKEQVLVRGMALPGQPIVLTRAADRGPMWNKKVREMRRDPTIALVRYLIMAPILAAKWGYEADEDAPEGAEELVQGNMDKHRLRLLRHVLRGWMDFGWQPFEKIWSVNSRGQAVYSRFKPLLQDITEILVDEHGKYNGLKQTVDDELVLTVEETLLVSHDVEGTDWYGQPMMGAVETPYDAWVDTSEQASRYDKKVSGAHWVVYYPTSPGETMFRGVMTANYDIALMILDSLEANGRIAVPRVIDQMMSQLGQAGDNSWKVELMSDSGAGTTSFVDRMKYLDSLKVRALGVPERAVLEGQFGTKAEAGEHADFAITAMEQRHAEIVLDINEHAVRHLLTVNYGEEYRDTVRIVPSPIADAQRAFLYKLYQSILASPLGFDLVASSIDVGAIQDQLGVPFTESQTETEDDPLLEGF